MKKCHKCFKLTQVALILLALFLSSCNKTYVLEPAAFWDFTNLTQTSPTHETYIIAIDPGHGGMDTGAGGIIEELQVVEKTSDYLYEFLQNDTNYNPVKTRQNGEDLSNTDRAKNATESGAQLLISVHANKDSHANSYGFECYSTPPGREHHEQSLIFAQHIATEMQAAGNRLRGETGVRYLYYINNKKTIVDSTDTQIRQSESFGILEKAPCPAVLVEQCFLSNSNDVDEWASDDGCKKSAYVYYTAICKYFGTKPIDFT